MCLGWMFFNATFYGLLTWMPTYLFNGPQPRHQARSAAHPSSSSFQASSANWSADWIGDRWRSSGGSPNLVFRTLFGIAAIMATISIFLVAYSHAILVRRAAALLDAVLSALVRDVLGHSRRLWRGAKNPASSAAA